MGDCLAPPHNPALELEFAALAERIRRMNKEPGFWYVASPYTKYHLGHEAAFRAVAEQTANLTAAGVLCVSAITATHPIYEAKPELGGAWETWQALDKALIRGAEGVIVVQLPGWDESTGVRAEIAFALGEGKPVVYMKPGSVPEELIR